MGALTETTTATVLRHFSNRIASELKHSVYLYFIPVWLLVSCYKTRGSCWSKLNFRLLQRLLQNFIGRSHHWKCYVVVKLQRMTGHIFLFDKKHLSKEHWGQLHSNLVLCENLFHGSLWQCWRLSGSKRHIYCWENWVKKFSRHSIQSCCLLQRQPPVHCFQVNGSVA